MSNKHMLFKAVSFTVLCGMALAACGPAGAPTPEVIEVTKIVAGTPVVEVVTATPEAEPVVEKPTGDIVLWGWTAAIQDCMQAAGVFDTFSAEYADINVDYVAYSPDDVYTNLPLAITAADKDPDVCLVENSHLAQFVHMGGLLDLTEWVEPYIDKMNDYKWTDCEMDGRYYCMPWDSGPVVMYYRRDAFDAAGLPSDPDSVSELVATWDKYYETCQTIKDATGFACFAHNKANNYARLYEMALWQQGLGYYDLETGEVTVDSPGNIATLEMFGRFWEAGLVSDALEWTDPWYAELASLESPIATLVEASWMEVFMKSWIAPGTAGKWGVTYMPAMEEGQVRAANDGGSTFVIPVASDQPEAAWAFIEHALGKEDSQLRMFAISGFIPSLETTYDDPLFLGGDSFFSGQNARAIYAEVVAQIPSAGIYGPNYNMMNGAVSAAIQAYAAGQLTAAEALSEAAAEIRANLE